MQPSQPTTPPKDQPPVASTTINGNKKRLFVAVLFLLVLLTTVLLIRDQQPATPTDQEASELARKTSLISITSNGFEPATVTIKKGQAVEWTNNDEAQHQIASDPHPTDDALPNLNDNIPLDSGDSFSYVFDKTGTYTYHDELNPLKFNGTVIVEE